MGGGSLNKTFIKKENLNINGMLPRIRIRDVYYFVKLVSLLKTKGGSETGCQGQHIVVCPGSAESISYNNQKLIMCYLNVISI